MREKPDPIDRRNFLKGALSAFGVAAASPVGASDFVSTVTEETDPPQQELPPASERERVIDEHVALFNSPEARRILESTNQADDEAKISLLRSFPEWLMYADSPWYADTKYDPMLRFKEIGFPAVQINRRDVLSVLAGETEFPIGNVTETTVEPRGTTASGTAFMIRYTSTKDGQQRLALLTNKHVRLGLDLPEVVNDIPSDVDVTVVRIPLGTKGLDMPPLTHEPQDDEHDQTGKLIFVYSPSNGGTGNERMYKITASVAVKITVALEQFLHRLPPIIPGRVGGRGDTPAPPTDMQTFRVVGSYLYPAPAIEENQVELGVEIVAGDLVRYADTTGQGTSGSPVLDARWHPIGVHHAGGSFEIAAAPLAQHAETLNLGFMFPLSMVIPGLP